jgi:hypothetical protein
MANQTTTTNKRSPSQATPQPARRGTPTGAQRAPVPPAERDETYDLISVIYHSLQGSDTIGKYLEDARRANADELVEFFARCKRQHDLLAREGKRLLASQLAEVAEDEDEDESDDDEDEDDDEDDEDEDEDEES